MRATSGQVLNLLMKKHSKDLCVPECKGGSTWFSKHLRIDLWAMARSWVKPRMYGYEIKVDRQDFLRDDKWRGYLEYCTDFYFVAPPGVIEPDELPAEAGLLVTSKNIKCLYTKKKAPTRSAETIPETIYRYVLMSRTTIRDEYKPISSKEYWSRWLEERELDYDFGRRVSKEIRCAVDEKINAVSEENVKLKLQIDNLAEIKELCDRIGFKPQMMRAYNGGDSFKAALNKALNGIPSGFDGSVQRSIQTLQTLRDELQSMEREALCHTN